MCRVPEKLRPGVTGYLATPDDASDFCKGSVQLLSNRSPRASMSQQCRAIVLEEYSL